MLKIFVGKKGSGEELKWESLAMDELGSVASTADMFGNKRTFLLIGALAGERAEEFLDMAEVLVESPHEFVFEEEKLLKRETDILTKAGAKLEKPAQSGSASGRQEWKFDQHGIASALGAKDKKKLWLGLMSAFRNGEKGEAVAGLMAWKARQLKDANLSRQLVKLYHDSHRGAGDLELLLERFVLKF